MSKQLPEVQDPADDVPIDETVDDTSMQIYASDTLGRVSDRVELMPDEKANNYIKISTRE